MICISVGDRSVINDVNRLRPSLVEVRYDLLRKSPDEIMPLFSDSILQVATCRPGQYSGSERLRILQRAMELGAVYVDVEIESEATFIQKIIDVARRTSVHVILSFHDFDKTPSRTELLKTLQQCYAAGGDIAKIACQVNEPGDAARLLSLYDEPGRKIVLGMGELGRITRLASLDLGAEFTFAAQSESAATAPGQIAYSELLSLQNKLKNR